MPLVPDTDRLIAEVAARHGVLLKRDDAAFALVTLNQLVLEQTLAEVETAVRTAVEEIDTGATRLQARVGGILGQEIRQAFLELKKDILATANREPHPSHRSAWLWTAVAGAAIFAAGIGVGILLK